MTEMTRLAFASATELVAALRERRVSSRETVNLYLRRIEHRNPALNALVTIDAERLRGDAAAAADGVARGRLRRPLHRLPATIENAIETGGMRTAPGSPTLAGGRMSRPRAEELKVVVG